MNWNNRTIAVHYPSLLYGNSENPGVSRASRAQTEISELGFPQLSVQSFGGIRGSSYKTAAALAYQGQLETSFVKPYSSSLSQQHMLVISNSHGLMFMPVI